MTIENEVQVSQDPTRVTMKSSLLIGAAFILGVILTIGLTYMNRSQLIRWYLGIRSAASPMQREAVVNAPIPECIPEQIKSGTDKDIIVYAVKYDQLMTPRLQALLAILTDSTYKGLVSGEIARQTSEVAAMKNLYKSLYGSEYPKNATSSLETLLHFPDDNLVKNDYPGFTDQDRLSLVQGQMQYMEREFYAFAALSKNAQIKKNADDFSTAKARFFDALSGR